MLSKSNSNIPVKSRRNPTCTRCRNHGIYFVPLKDHKNVCPHRHCSCGDCGLIVERNRLAVKPGRQTKVIGEKSRRRKKRPSNMTQKREDLNASEVLIDPTVADGVPTSCLSGKGHPTEPIKNNLPAANAAEVYSATQGSSNLLQEQPRLLPVCANLSSPPHSYYGYVQRPRRMRNFNPGAPPNVTIGPQGFHRVMVPEQGNLFLSYSPLDSPNFSLPCFQGFAIHSAPLNLSGLQCSPEHF